MSNQQQQETVEPQASKNTRYWGYLILMVCLMVGCVGMYYLAGAFFTGVVGLGTLAGLFQRAVGA